jgi:hypothetical protein
VASRNIDRRFHIGVIDHRSVINEKRSIGRPALYSRIQSFAVNIHRDNMGIAPNGSIVYLCYLFEFAARSSTPVLSHSNRLTGTELQ